MRSVKSPHVAFKISAALLLAAVLCLQSFPLVSLPALPGDGAVMEGTAAVSALNVCDGEGGGGTAGPAERLCTEAPSAPVPSTAEFSHPAVPSPPAAVTSSRLFRPPRS